MSHGNVVHKCVAYTNMTSWQLSKHAPVPVGVLFLNGQLANSPPLCIETLTFTILCLRKSLPLPYSFLRIRNLPAKLGSAAPKLWDLYFVTNSQNLMCNALQEKD